MVHRYRNKILVKEVLERDKGICCCCGFKAAQVHHITPLVYGGKDEKDNMVAICEIDHLHAPDTKEEFLKYKENGGIKIDLLRGICLKYFSDANIPFNNINSLMESINTYINSIKESQSNENIINS